MIVARFYQVNDACRVAIGLASEASGRILSGLRFGNGPADDISMKQTRRPFAVGRGIAAALVAVAVTAHAPAASAEQGAIVSATVSATSIDAGVSPGVTGSF